jgi:hypothetical protein
MDKGNRKCYISSIRTYYAGFGAVGSAKDRRRGVFDKRQAVLSRVGRTRSGNPLMLFRRTAAYPVVILFSHSLCRVLRLSLKERKFLPSESKNQNNYEDS